MRDRLVANISDFLKLAFLRTIACNDRLLGIAWYYVPAKEWPVEDRRYEWANESAWKELDPGLFHGLTRLTELSVSGLEDAAVWPKGTIFHREPIPTPIRRDAWGMTMRAELSEPNFVYLDPDVGLGGMDRRHATFAELARFRRPGRSVAFITFPGKAMPYDAQLAQLHRRLREESNVEKFSR